MGRTEVTSEQIKNEDIWREDVNVSDSGKALITKVIAAGVGLSTASTGADEGTGDVTLQIDSGEFGGNYASFTSNSQATTTSNNWVTKATFLTDKVNSIGKYIINFQAELTNSNKQKAVGYRVQWREQGGSWATLVDVRGGVPTDDEWDLRSGFREVDLTVEAKIQTRVQYGQTDDGGEGKIKNANIYLFKAGA